VKGPGKTRKRGRIAAIAANGRQSVNRAWMDARGYKLGFYARNVNKSVIGEKSMAKEEQKDGGPVYPPSIIENTKCQHCIGGEVRDKSGVACEYCDGRGFYNVTVGPPGMSLRDYFAGQALLALHNDKSLGGTLAAAKETGESITDFIAGTAYEIADAMLEARGGHED